MGSSLVENLAAVQKRIDDASRRSNRRPDEIKLVAVTKTHPTATILQAIGAGVNAFGENKVQEAEVKIEEIGRSKVEWHLIGHLQSNKVRKAVQLFDVIHSLDSLELAQRLERICVEEGCERLSVFVHVDLAGEETKSGISENDLPHLVELLLTCRCLSFDGLMILPPYFENADDTRPFFRRLREIRDDLTEKGTFRNGIGELSMGMSHDFEFAIEEGATLVRVGTAIFGEREMNRG